MADPTDFDLTTTHGAHGTLVNDDIVNRARSISAERRHRLEALRTREEAEAYVRYVRAKVRACFSAPFPGEKCPLKAEVTKVTEYEKFVIECVVFESRPDFPVSAAVYRPKTPGKHPGVVFLSGHANEGKAWDIYMVCCQTLAQMGCVVIAPDPIGMGERWQFVGAENGEPILENCCWQHNHLGKQLLLCGEFFGSWRVWDAIRSVDYLLTRPDVDCEKIGATGTSGGGTLSSFLYAMDDRVKVLAPGSYITAWRRLFENELPIDSEQCPPGLLGQGLEMVDLLLARAPHPVRILSQRNDYFDVRGAKEAFADMKRIYKLLGAEDAVEQEITPDLHGFTEAQRAKMYEFFNNLFDLHAVPDDELKFDHAAVQASQTGQLVEQKGRPCRLVYDFMGDMLDRYHAERHPLSLAELRAYFKDALRLPEPSEMTPRDYRVLEPVYTSLEKLIGRFRLESDDGVDVILKVADTPHAWQIPEMESARLYVPHLDSIVEHEDLPPADGYDCLLDIRGIGELEPSGSTQLWRDFFAPYQGDFFYESCYRMLGTSYMAGKVRDIFKGVGQLRAFGCKRLVLRGHGQGSIPVAIASLFLDCDVELTGAPVSWEEMVRTRVTAWPQSAMVAGVLATTDLPDIYAALGPRLKLLTHWDAMMRP